MRLTSQVLSDAPTIINPEKQVTLLLRSLKIPYLENLGITKDTYEVIDLTDNELIELSNFPRLKNLKVLLVGNNNITGINDDKLPNNLPHLQSISFIHNNISKFLDVRILCRFKNLSNITFIDNPITDSSNYRYFIIWLIPTLKVLDFSKVKQKELMKAKELFGESIEDPSELALSMLEDISTTESRKNQILSKDMRNLQDVGKKLTDEDKAKLLRELETADSVEDIERIERALHNGHM